MDVCTAAKWMQIASWAIWGAVVIAAILLVVFLGVRTTYGASVERAIVLVASPKVSDPYYQRAVVVVAELPNGGHVGLIANRPTAVKVSELFPGFAPAVNVREPVFFGGPMMPRQMGMVVKEATPQRGTFQMMPGAWLVLTAADIDRQMERAPNAARYFVGLIVWLPGELDEEIRSGFWHQIPAPSNALWVKDASRMWQDLLPKGPNVRLDTGRLQIGIRG